MNQIEHSSEEVVEGGYTLTEKKRQDAIMYIYFNEPNGDIEPAVVELVEPEATEAIEPATEKAIEMIHEIE